MGECKTVNTEKKTTWNKGCYCKKPEIEEANIKLRVVRGKLQISVTDANDNPAKDISIEKKPLKNVSIIEPLTILYSHSSPGCITIKSEIIGEKQICWGR